MDHVWAKLAARAGGLDLTVPVAFLLIGALITAAVFLILRRVSHGSPKGEPGESKDYSEYEAIIRASYKKLSKPWTVIEVVNDISRAPLGPAGLPVGIDLEQALDVLRKIRDAHNHPIALVLHTLGGGALASEMIADALVHHHGRKIAWVPYTAMSGGTVIALAADEIEMGPTATLGPIDSQYGGVSFADLSFLKDKKGWDKMKDEFVLLYHQAESSQSGAFGRAARRLNPHYKEHKDAIVRALMKGAAHDDAISADDARGFGVKVSKTPCPEAVFALVNARLGILSRRREQVAREGLGLLGG